MMVEERRATRSPAALAPVILGMCAAAFLLAWLPRLHWGFWTDEAGTFWMASRGWREAIGRTSGWPGQSILYSVLESFFVARGFWEEPLMRVPSVLAIAAAAWQLKRIAELLIDRTAGWVAVLPFVCAPEIVLFGTSARPYALALAASLASFRYLLEWQNGAGGSTLAKYLIASILTLQFHYFFGFVFVIQGAYLAFSALRGRKIPLSLPLLAVVILPASLLPLIPSLRVAAKQSAGFAHAVRPSWTQLAQVCFPPVLLLATGLGLVLLLVTGRNVRWRPARLRPEVVFLIAAWMTLGPLAFFLAARVTEQSVFATRYLLFALPGFVLLLAWVVCGLEKREWRLLILIAMFAGTVLHPGNLWLGFHESSSSWREPLRLIETESAPVLVASGVVESGSLAWSTLDPATSSVYAALTAYPIRNPTIPLPFQFGDQVKNFIQGLQLPDRCFLLAAADSEVGTWMTHHMEQRGYRATAHAVNDFVVIDFRRGR